MADSTDNPLGEKGEEDTPAGRRAKMLREMEEEEKEREAAEAEIEAEEEAAVEKLKEELMAMELEELRALAGGSKAKGRDLRGVEVESDWDDIEEMDDPKEEIVKRILAAPIDTGLTFGERLRKYPAETAVFFLVIVAIVCGILLTLQDVDSCTGTAEAVPASCTGTATSSGIICDLDAATNGTADCPAGCASTDATTPTCDLDASTDGTADCVAGCTFHAAGANADCTVKRTDYASGARSGDCDVDEHGVGTTGDGQLRARGRRMLGAQGLVL